jgi:hypothetical protein
MNLWLMSFKGVSMMVAGVELDEVLEEVWEEGLVEGEEAAGVEEVAVCNERKDSQLLLT